MLNQQLLNPQSIVIIGGSNDLTKPGGNLIKNIIKGGFKGRLMVVNPNEDTVQGISCYKDVKDLPEVDLAILAIHAKKCVPVIKILCHKKSTRAFIIISSAFSESGSEGSALEKEIVQLVNKTEGCLIGPNCIGVINCNYCGVFTTPLPMIKPFGINLISDSGSTAVFIMETGIPKGLVFSSVYSVGNSAQTGIEEILQHIDANTDKKNELSPILLYLEKIRKPQKFLYYASSLRLKGYKIAAIKSGTTEAGSRAATSHTGAIASPDIFVEALLKKAGIIRCQGREEIVNVASLFLQKDLEGNKIAIITHAGGPAIMLSDILIKNNFEISDLSNNQHSGELLSKLTPGSSIKNPIDILATGTAEQLSHAIDFCEKKCKNVDGIVIIFGSPGLDKVDDVYDMLNDKIQTCKKPIYPVFPSSINAAEEMERFVAKGRTIFTDEVEFGKALARVYNSPSPVDEDLLLDDFEEYKVLEIIGNAKNGYLTPDEENELFQSVGINKCKQKPVHNINEAILFANETGYPVVLKPSGPMHKTETGAVKLDIHNEKELKDEYNKIMRLNGIDSIIIQPMINGIELFLGATREPHFGQLIVFGMGGIYVEVFKDINTALSPVTHIEALQMIHNLKGYPILTGARGKEAVCIDTLAEIIVRFSLMAQIADEIIEMDINPLMAEGKNIIAVDTRVRVEKQT